MGKKNNHLFYVPIFFFFILISNASFAMDPLKVSFLTLPQPVLVKIIADKALKNKHRSRLMQTCKDLSIFASPENLLKETIPLHLYRNIRWPAWVLDIAVINKSLDCCTYILNSQYNEIDKNKKMLTYKVSRNKSLVRRQAKALYEKSLFFSIPLRLKYMFNDNSLFLRESVNIPLVTEKNIIQNLFNKIKKPMIAQYYAQENVENMKWYSRLEGIEYPVNLLGHACFFGNVDMLKSLLFSCQDINHIYKYCKDPSDGLALSAEYDNPDCFKVLYDTPWLKPHFEVYGKPSEMKCNYLEAFVLYIHNKKIIETLLKTGCFDINDYIHVRKRMYDKPVIKKSFKGKTLLDIVLKKKDKCLNNHYFIYSASNLNYSDTVDCSYYEEIAQLLRKYGAKTALEIAAIHPFNEYFPDDIKNKFIYEHNILTQQKFRGVCKEWKDKVDNNQLRSYFTLLRDKKPHYTCLKNNIRILCAAMYKKEEVLVKTLFEVFKRKNIKRTHYYSDFSCKVDLDLLECGVCYELFEFIQDKPIKKLSTRYYPYDIPDIRNPSLFTELIVASFLNDAKELKNITTFLEEELNNSHSAFVHITPYLGIRWNDVTQKVLQDACIILADYNYDTGLYILVHVIKKYPFFNAFFHNLVLACYYFKSLQALSVLLSCGININLVNDKNHTIKDDIIENMKIFSDNDYISSVMNLLDTYGAKTYKEYYHI